MIAKEQEIFFLNLKMRSMMAEALIGKEMCDTTKVKPCGTTEDTDIMDDTEFVQQCNKRMRQWMA